MTKAKKSPKKKIKDKSENWGEWHRISNKVCAAVKKHMKSSKIKVFSKGLDSYLEEKHVI